MADRINISVYPDKKADKGFRDILGINNIPRITSTAVKTNDKLAFEKLNFGHIRFHDAPLENPGQQLIDIRKIFPLFHLDENDPRNYFFAQTDDYLSYLEGSDAEIDFRIGETIDHSRGAHFISVPDDIEKWARVCRNIVAHYKNGEMNGMHLNITRVTVWEEPDNPILFKGTAEEYAKMFCAVYRLLKKDFPDIKIGGPTTFMPDDTEFFVEALENIKKEGIKPDYITNTTYQRSVENLMQCFADYRKILDDMGFEGVKQSLSEWHLGPIKFALAGKRELNGFSTSKSAAFTVSALVDMMDTDYVDVAYYYCWGLSAWGFIDTRMETRTYYPLYYALILYNNFIKGCTERFVCSADDKNVRAIAGKTKDGKLGVLISCYECPTNTVSLKIDGAKNCTIKTIGADFNEKLATEGATLETKDGEYSFLHVEDDGVYYLEFDM